jgi:plasmid stability protein
MPVNLSIKDVPDDLAARLRRRAAGNHRSLQGELLALLEEALGERGPLSPAQVLARVRDRGVRTTADSVEILRETRRRG